MNINKLLANSKMAKNAYRKPGRESDWVKVAKLNLKGATLQFAEKRIMGAAGEGAIMIKASPGEYIVECKTMAFDTDIRVSRMRTMLAGTRPIIGNELGKISADIGGIAVVDIDTFTDSIENNQNEYQKWLEAVLIENPDPVGIVDWKPGELKIPYANGGFGSGSCPVFELREKSDIVGLEVEYIRAGTGYPFK